MRRAVWVARRFAPGARVIDKVTAGERRLVDLRLQLAGVTDAIEVPADNAWGHTFSPEPGGPAAFLMMSDR